MELAINPLMGILWYPLLMLILWHCGRTGDLLVEGRLPPLAAVGDSPSKPASTGDGACSHVGFHYLSTPTMSLRQTSSASDLEATYFQRLSGYATQVMTTKPAPIPGLST